MEELFHTHVQILAQCGVQTVRPVRKFHYPVLETEKLSRVHRWCSPKSSGVGQICSSGGETSGVADMRHKHPPPPPPFCWQPGSVFPPSLSSANNFTEGTYLHTIMRFPAELACAPTGWRRFRWPGMVPFHERRWVSTRCDTVSIFVRI